MSDRFRPCGRCEQNTENVFMCDPCRNNLTVMVDLEHRISSLISALVPALSERRKFSPWEVSELYDVLQPEIMAHAAKSKP